MFQLLWSRIVRTTPLKRPQQPSAAHGCGKRLHAEQLEARLLMAANTVAGQSLAANAAIDIVARASAIAVPAAAPSATTHTAVPPKTVQPDWQQFGSKEAFEAWLIRTADAQYGQLFGQKTYYYGSYGFPWGNGQYDGSMVLFRRTTTASANLGSLTDSYSSTNVQVAGVDEADLVETDGSYLYIISSSDLVIVKAGVGSDLQIMSRTHLAARPVGMYLDGDRLAIVSSNDASLFGYFDQPAITTVSIFNIANRSNPKLAQTTEMDGHLITSRMVDGELRLVLSNQIALPAPIARPTGSQSPSPGGQLLFPSARPNVGLDLITTNLWRGDWSGQEAVYETRDEYIARIRDEVLGSLIPQARSLSQDGGVISQQPLYDAGQLYRPDSEFDQTVTTIATFDLASNRRGPTATQSVVMSGPPQVYATADSIYLFAAKSVNPSVVPTGYPQTVVWKFSMSGGRNGVKLAAKGQFEGSLLNQFSADEQGGLLRVVTQGYSWASSDHALRVLQQVGRRLNVVGEVDGIAEHEQIYSVRFMGDRAYIVTFLQTDPLYVVDLSDPLHPQVAGDLQLPGFSDYLQPIDDTHLLAIGRGANEQTGVFDALQVSIFDVTDLTNPLLVDRYSFDGGRSTATPATGNRWTRGDGDPHAVSYFADASIFALPVFSADMYSFLGMDPALFSPGQGGLEVFHIDVHTGFKPLGVIEHDTLVERSVQIGDRLYAISSDSVTVHPLTDPTLQLGEVGIADTSSPPTITDLPPSPLRWPIRQLVPFELPAVLPSDSLGTVGVGWASPKLTPTIKRSQRELATSRFAVISEPRLDDALVTLLANDSTSNTKHHDGIRRDIISSSATHADGCTDDLQVVFSDWNLAAIL